VLVPSNSNIWIQIVFASFLPLTFAGFFFYYGPLWLWKKWGLVNIECKPMQMILEENNAINEKSFNDILAVSRV
jgi:hypothetical protein